MNGRSEGAAARYLVGGVPVVAAASAGKQLRLRDGRAAYRASSLLTLSLGPDANQSLQLAGKRKVRYLGCKDMAQLAANLQSKETNFGA